VARSRLVLLAILAAALSGCATVPTSSAARALPGNGEPPEAFVQPLPPQAPGSLVNWSPQDVVEAFLQASASDVAVARRYLMPGVRWHPPGSVTVVAGNFLEKLTVYPRLSGSNVAQVTVSGQQLASLSDTGQYIYQPGTARYTFKLGQYNGAWLIETLPEQTLLLTQTDFQEVYQPRSLFFFSGLGDLLVPDPVFAPVQGVNGALSTDVAADLIKGLISDRPSWLSKVTATDFPAGTKLLGVSISNQTAIVNLGGAASRAPSAKREGMYAQLWQTLTSSAYSEPIATAVQLEINGAVQYISPGLAGDVPGTASSAKTETGYFADGFVVKALQPGSGSGPSQIAFPLLGTDITAVAVSRAGRPQLAVAVPDGRGCTVDVGYLNSASGYTTYKINGGPCTSLSWDSSGDLWAAAGGSIWVLQPGYSAPAQVRASSLAPGSEVLALRIAADSVRAALLVQAPAAGRQMASQMYLTTVTSGSAGVRLGPTVPIGTDLTDPTAISWYGPYDLVAADAGSLYEVPLTGGQSQDLETAPADTISISSNGTAFAVVTGSGKLQFSPTLDGNWVPEGRASAVAYPG
jgi:Lipoprotein LpqB beta-propeller domain/Sporulation and spore germination